MEIVVTIAYVFLVRLVFFDYKLIRFTMFWKFVVFGLYAAAALTEIVMLGQYGPYSKQLVAEAYVIQLAPEFGGIVLEVPAKANQPMKKGEPVFVMDPSQWEQRLKEHQAEYALAKDTLARLTRAGVGAVSQEQIVAARDAMEAAEAEVERAQYNVDHTTIVAPANGYAVNLQLRPGAFIRLKSPVVTFVATDDLYLVATVNQRAARFVRAGNAAEVALTMYPGRVFEAIVDEVIWAGGAGVQLGPGGGIPSLATIHGSEEFAVRLRLTEPDPERPLEFGASGLTAIYTGRGPQVFKLLRQLEIRSESWLNYLYNPF